MPGERWNCTQCNKPGAGGLLRMAPFTCDKCGHIWCIDCVPSCKDYETNSRTSSSVENQSDDASKQTWSIGENDGVQVKERGLTFSRDKLDGGSKDSVRKALERVELKGCRR